MKKLNVKFYECFIGMDGKLVVVDYILVLPKNIVIKCQNYSTIDAINFFFYAAIYNQQQITEA